MFWEGGHLYVYFTYGMHFCANVVTCGRGIGEAVLIRAVEPVEGIEIMRRLRGRAGEDTNLSNGPANFCQAFGIRRPQNGIDLLGKDIYLLAGKEIPNSQIQTTTRVGIRKGTEKKWRFCVKGNPWVSGASKNSGR